MTGDLGSAASDLIPLEQRWQESIKSGRSDNRSNEVSLVQRKRSYGKAPHEIHAHIQV